MTPLNDEKAAPRHHEACGCHGDLTDWYRRYASPIRQYALSLTRDPFAAEDCTSETFLRAFTRRHAFRCSGDGVRPWLFTIARNLARDHHNKAYRRYEVATDVITEEPDSVPEPEHHLLRQETRTELAQLVNRLSDDQALCLRLRFGAGLSVGETALAMKRTDMAIRALQFRAVRRLATMHS